MPHSNALALSQRSETHDTLAVTLSLPLVLEFWLTDYDRIVFRKARILLLPALLHSSACSGDPVRRTFLAPTPVKVVAGGLDTVKLQDCATNQTKYLPPEFLVFDVAEQPSF